jgi:hypothetical protein
MQRRMRQMYLFAVVPVALLVVLGSTAFAQSNPFIGTWKLNVAKSKNLPGAPPMRPATRVNEAWETNGVKFTQIVVQADGTSITAEFSAHFDGTDYKGPMGNPNFDTIAFKRVNANTHALTWKKGGKVVVTGTVVVSKNGRMMTETITLTNAKGRKVNIWSVWDKQ